MNSRSILGWFEAYSTENRDKIRLSHSAVYQSAHIETKYAKLSQPKITVCLSLDYSQFRPQQTELLSLQWYNFWLKVILSTFVDDFRLSAQLIKSSFLLTSQAPLKNCLTERFFNSAARNASHSLVEILNPNTKMINWFYKGQTFSKTLSANLIPKAVFMKSQKPQIFDRSQLSGKFPLELASTGRASWIRGAGGVDLTTDFIWNEFDFS